jgi:hypothetical protein
MVRRYQSLSCPAHYFQSCLNAISDLKLSLRRKVVPFQSTMIGEASIQPLTSFSVVEVVLETRLSMAAFQIGNEKDRIGESRPCHSEMLTNRVPVL